jgi:L-fuconolactonase
MPTIDAHQHLWQLGQFNYSWLDAPKLAPIKRNFLPPDLEPLLKAAAIDYSIVVQTQHDVRENTWALSLADHYPFLAGVVGWVDLASPACEEQVVEFRRHPKACGIRHITQDEPDDNFILRDDVLRGLMLLEKHQVPFDLLFYVKHLRHAATLARRLPDLPLVIDHLAKPQVKLGRTDDWLENFRAAAACPNVYCKLSGLVTEADWEHWQPNDLKPYVQAALELFGPGRLMYGSDWPVSTLAGNYLRVKQALDEALGPISKDERAQIYGLTAEKFYRLKLS